MRSSPAGGGGRKAFSVDPPKVGSVDAMYCTAMRWNAPPTPGALAPVRVMLSRPSTLNRPHPPCSRAHRNFTAQRLICDASAVRERLGHPRAVPVFRCPFLPGMPPPTTPGSSTMVSSRAATSMVPSARSHVSALPSLPQSVSRGASISGLPRFTHLLRPARLLGALYGSDRLPGQRRLLLPGFQRDRPVAGYDYSGCWTPPLVGVSPTGMTTRLAARLRMMPTFPRSHLRFRKTGFPRSGSKAGLSDRAFPNPASVKLAPSMPVA